MTVKIIKPPIGKKFSRDEGFWTIFTTMDEDLAPNRANILDTINYIEQKLIFRTIEGKDGVSVNIEDVDSNPYTTEQKITIGIDTSAIVSLLGITVLKQGVTANTVPVTRFNFTGDGVTVTETSAGTVDINITNLGTFEARIDGSAYPTLFSTFNFVNGNNFVKNAGGGVLEIDLSAIAGIQIIDTQSIVYSGVTITSGTAILSGFFGPYAPNPVSTIVSINGLILKYSTNPATSDFDISGNNLIINVDNLNYSLDNNDEIISYFWI